MPDGHLTLRDIPVLFAAAAAAAAASTFRSDTDPITLLRSKVKTQSINFIIMEK